MIPDLVAVVIEDEVCVLRRREPETMGELALELTRRPAGVAERDEALVGAALVADVAQDLAARGQIPSTGGDPRPVESALDELLRNEEMRLASTPRKSSRNVVRFGKRGFAGATRNRLI